MNAIESDQQAGYPPANSPGGNPSDPQPDQLSFSWSTGNRSNEETPDLEWQIALCMHNHHGGIGPEIPAEVAKANSDLMNRTWKKSTEMGRDERRLHQRYKAIIEEAETKFASIARAKWLDCPKCPK